MAYAAEGEARALLKNPTADYLDVYLSTHYPGLRAKLGAYLDQTHPMTTERFSGICETLYAYAKENKATAIAMAVVVLPTICQYWFPAQALIRSTAIAYFFSIVSTGINVKLTSDVVGTEMIGATLGAMQYVGSSINKLGFCNAAYTIGKQSLYYFCPPEYRAARWTQLQLENQGLGAYIKNIALPPLRISMRAAGPVGALFLAGLFYVTSELALQETENDNRFWSSLNFALLGLNIGLYAKDFITTATGLLRPHTPAEKLAQEAADFLELARYLDREHRADPFLLAWIKTADTDLTARRDALRPLIERMQGNVNEADLVTWFRENKIALSDDEVYEILALNLGEEATKKLDLLDAVLSVPDIQAGLRSRQEAADKKIFESLTDALKTESSLAELNRRMTHLAVTRKTLSYVIGGLTSAVFAVALNDLSRQAVLESPVTAPLHFLHFDNQHVAMWVGLLPTIFSYSSVNFNKGVGRACGHLFASYFEARRSLVRDEETGSIMEKTHTACETFGRLLVNSRLTGVMTALGIAAFSASTAAFESNRSSSGQYNSAVTPSIYNEGLEKLIELMGFEDFANAIGMIVGVNAALVNASAIIEPTVAGAQRVLCRLDTPPHATPGPFSRGMLEEDIASTYIVPGAKEGGPACN